LEQAGSVIGLFAVVVIVVGFVPLEVEKSGNRYRR
jgi:hypothetical protein